MAQGALGYIGETYRVPEAAGGWNANPNIDVIPPEAMTDARNINLHKGGRTTRGGVSKVNGTAITNAVQVMGGFWFKKQNGNEFIVTTTTDGKIQRDYVNELNTGMSTAKYSSFEVFNDTLYISNGADRPQTWDGVAATTSNLTSVPTDWSGSNWPFQIIKHGKGLSERLWAFVKSGVYASGNGNDNFSDATVVNIPISTGDGFGLVAGVEFGDNLICFGKRTSFIIDDSDATSSNWGYVQAQWTGGAAHARAVCKTPNDIVVFDEQLEVYSVTAAQEYGDYKAASLTRPAYINTWIGNNVDLTQIEKFHIIYDRNLRAIKLFVVTNGNTKCDTALVFFIDKGAENGWVRHVYAETNYASCSFETRIQAGEWKIYTGGHDGYVYQLETSSFNDNGNYYYNGYTKPYLTFDNARITKHYNDGWLVIIPQGTETITIKCEVDGSPILGGYMLVTDTGAFLTDENGNRLWGNTDETFQVTASASNTLQNLKYHIGREGNRIRTEVYNKYANTSFFIAEQLFDFESLEARPR